MTNDATASGNHHSEPSNELGDFTTTNRVIFISLIAMGIGILSSFVALALLRLINLFTNLFYYFQWSTAPASPSGNHLGFMAIFVPVVGALIVGFMARYGSEKIRGHGIPEAIEAILINGSRIEPRVAALKPLSSAISIGSGGPFGAEGPIIMTGGAIGSLVAQFLHLTNAERKTLLVAGAAAGMSATFAAPVAAVLLSVELLLYEWKPRSLIPVALASAVAAIARRYLLGLGPLFPVPQHNAFIGLPGMLGCILMGILIGVLSALLTKSIYAAEDTFAKLPIHWMWWPAIGGLVIGIGGLISPRALGVGYDSIAALLQGNMTLRVMIGLLIVKWIIWSISLGSGTSGGVLAPLLMMGGALGGVMSTVLPYEGAGFWPLVSMAAVLGATLRVPFTGVIFALELTNDVSALLPLLLTVMVAYGFMVLTMRRSIMTEKVARRGYHLSQEDAVDPLEAVFVRDVMRTKFAVLPATLDLTDVAFSINNHRKHGQRLYPVVDDQDELTGVLTHAEIQQFLGEHANDSKPHQLIDLVKATPDTAFPDDPLRAVVHRMSETGLTRFPVVERNNPRKLVGMVSLKDLLKARVRSQEEEHRRERVLTIRRFSPLKSRKEPVG